MNQVRLDIKRDFSVQISGLKTEIEIEKAKPRGPSRSEMEEMEQKVAKAAEEQQKKAGPPRAAS